jgi:hypothetical protein
VKKRFQSLGFQTQLVPLQHGQLQNQRTWLIENTLVERSDGAVLMLFRTKVGPAYTLNPVDP